MSADGSIVTSASGCRTWSTTAATSDASTSSPDTAQRSAATLPPGAGGARSGPRFSRDTVPDAIPPALVGPNRSPGPAWHAMMDRVSAPINNRPAGAAPVVAALVAGVLLLTDACSVVVPGIAHPAASQPAEAATASLAAESDPAGRVAA